MRFLDYDGSGNLDPQDIAASIALEESARSDEMSVAATRKSLKSNAGCAAMAAVIALPILIVSLAL